MKETVKGSLTLLLERARRALAPARAGPERGVHPSPETRKGAAGGVVVLSDSCAEGRHDDCSGLGTLWSFESAILACTCSCHPFDHEAVENAFAAEREKREQREQEIRTRYTVSVGTRAEWRRWLEANHASSPAACVAYMTGRALTFSEAADEALCFGWVDEKVDPTDRSQFFTPREKGSWWSPYHRSRFSTLMKAGLVTEAGIAVGPQTEEAPRRGE